MFYTDRDEVVESARTRLAKAFRVGPSPPEKRSRILGLIDNAGMSEWTPL